MSILSWDVGVIHLGFCILKESYNKNGFEILDWEEISLLEDDRIQIDCCGKKKDEVNCDKKATYYLQLPDKTCGFCKTHVAQADEIWSKKDTLKLFHSTSKEKTCQFQKKDSSLCGKKAKTYHATCDTNVYYCNAHLKSEQNKLIKLLSPQPIKNLIVKKYPTAQLQLNLINKLDSMIERLALLGVEEVVIENQPSQKNPKMKSIANTLFDYFMIRGYVDHTQGLDVKVVRFICPSNKLMLEKDNTLAVFKKSKSQEKYKLTKQLGIQYTNQILSATPEGKMHLEYLHAHKKQDDMCDSFLQGLYYMNFIRKGITPGSVKAKADKKKSKSGSKTSKPKSKKNVLAL